MTRGRCVGRSGVVSRRASCHPQVVLWLALKPRARASQGWSLLVRAQMALRWGSECTDDECGMGWRVGDREEAERRATGHQVAEGQPHDEDTREWVLAILDHLAPLGDPIYRSSAPPGAFD
ncbi:hypothetical protein THAOC_22636 [Thalassiosira oceanica]|uniref:Uncharacterized protein n=1 Tax=Thalassiosira oceanica TaxID=159749 RepID=K0SFC9_THAOC|nr:hypothetical protein THAOC_22636 [Thalassiosira oceanica]|eukprot:EJK57332.1 hypothetical protein THAOC_22636 [Thalassiosira oceanica]